MMTFVFDPLRQSRRKVINIAIYFVLCLILISCKDEQTRKQTLNGWDVIADVSNSSISISHNNLGIALGNLQLQVISEGVKSDLTSWKVRRVREGLVVRTDNPVTSSWTFVICN